MANTSSLLGKRFTQLGESHAPAASSEARETIMQDIIPGADLEELPCLCGDTDAEELALATIDRWGLPTRTVLCVNCGLIRVNPRWEEKTYAQLYAGHYWKFHNVDEHATKERFNLSLRRATPHADFIKSHIDLREKNILEIGCSWGAGLQHLAGLGAKIVGYDYDEGLLKIGRENTGLDLRYGGIDDAIKTREHYDIVITRHVVEHFLHPVAELNQLKRLLKPGGLLCVEVPGVFDCPKDLVTYFDVFHAYLFTLQTLTNLMNSCGFKQIYGDEHIYSIWEMANVAADVQWSNPANHQKVLEHLLGVEAGWINSHKLSTRVLNKAKRVYKKVLGINE